MGRTKAAPSTPRREIRRAGYDPPFHPVVVRAALALDNWHGRDAERHLWHVRRLEDALRRDQRHALPFELEAFGKNLAQQHLVPMEPRLLPEELKSPRADPDIEICLSH
ncbi:MAG: hypothetical protein Q7W02_13455 [Candidatus Rokubacteria bacterium]|nr:hypothetical protein [Candidatus Rokubacteria bacterium]